MVGVLMTPPDSEDHRQRSHSSQRFEGKNGISMKGKGMLEPHCRSSRSVTRGRSGRHLAECAMILQLRDGQEARSNNGDGEWCPYSSTGRGDCA